MATGDPKTIRFQDSAILYESGTINSIEVVGGDQIRGKWGISPLPYYYPASQSGTSVIVDYYDGDNWHYDYLWSFPNPFAGSLIQS